MFLPIAFSGVDISILPELLNDGACEEDCDSNEASFFPETLESVNPSF